MTNSILNTIKQMLGLAEDYNVFDQDIIVYINSILSTLKQLGVKPKDGFIITGPDETWDELLDYRIDLNTVKTYIFLKTRLSFDPPSSSFVLSSIKDNIRELEWRIVMEIETSGEIINDD